MSSGQNAAATGASDSGSGTSASDHVHRHRHSNSGGSLEKELQTLERLIERLVKGLAGNAASGGASPSGASSPATSSPATSGGSPTTPQATTPTYASGSTPATGNSYASAPATSSGGVSSSGGSMPWSSTSSGTGSGGATMSGGATNYSGTASGDCSVLNGTLSSQLLSQADPIPENGGATKGTPTTDWGQASTEAPNAIAQSGPLKGIPNGDAITAAAKEAGCSPYLLAADAAVESGDNADNKIINNANDKDGQNQVNSGVWNSPSNPEQNAYAAARLIAMYTKQAGGNVAEGLDGYNTGSVDQAGYAAKGDNGGSFSSYAAGVANAYQNILAYENSIGNGPTIS